MGLNQYILSGSSKKKFSLMDRRTFIKSSIAVPAAVGVLAGCETETEPEAEAARNSFNPLARTDWGTAVHG